MADKFMLYDTDLGGQYAIPVDDTLYVPFMQNDGAFDSDRFFASLEALQEDNDGVDVPPAGFEPRRITLSHLIGSATLIVPVAFDFTKLQQLEESDKLDGNACDIVLTSGERNTNPDIEVS